MELHAETFAVAQAVDEVCSIIAPLAKKKGIAIVKREARCRSMNVTLR
jgi:hypothetical protein